MQKILSILLVMTLLLSLGACRKPQEQPDAQPGGSSLSTGTPSGKDPTRTPSGTTVPPVTDPATTPTTVPATEPTTVPTTVPETEPTEVATVPTEPELSLGELVAQTAAAQVGKEYLYGGAGPDNFDTSGLVYYCFVANGISAPRGTNAQAEYGTEVAKEDLRPGDVVFFWSDTPGMAQFVGVYIGSNQLISSSSNKGLVRQTDITSSYYVEHYVTARRFVDE